MRVYEFAKTKNLSTKETIELLRKEGFEISSHMAVLNQDALAFLEKILSRSEPEKTVSQTHSVTHTAQTQEAPQKAAPQKAAKKFPANTLASKHEPLPKIESKKAVKQFGLIVTPLMVSDIAESVHKPVAEVILTLLRWGHVFTKNSIIPEELVSRLAKQYNVPILEAEKEAELSLKKEVATGEHVKDRLPIVVVVGHVDHGKTTLLDHIRKTRVAAKEKGGITQHLGAYEATTPQGSIVFLDTPGHEAFSKIRSRGVKVADIAVLVVAADDGVMPQTVEAIKHIQAMGVPTVIAINKVDKVDPSRIEVVKREVSQHGLLPEDWGGDVICVPLSAKTGKGIDQLLEMIILQAHIMELRADVSGPAHGYVLESKFEKGRGIVATIICQRGLLSVGDYFKAGSIVGKVASLVDSRGKRLQQVNPSTPVLVAGFESLPEAGDLFEVIDKEVYKKIRLALEARKSFAPRTSSIKDVFNIIIKTDTNSSKEALMGSIEKINKKLDKGYYIVQSGVGNVSESNITLALNTGSKIIALHVKPEASVMQFAARLGVDIKLYEIIYKLLEDLEAISEGSKEIKKIKTKIGEAVVLKVFDIKNLGVIAGCYIREGRFNKEGTVIVYRGNRKVGEGSIKSLQRDRKQVKEVHSNYECGFLVEGFDAWQPDDRVECYLELPEGSK